MNSKNKNRSFGLLFSAIFAGFGLWPLIKGENVIIYLIIISLTFLLLGLLNSKILSPINKAWIKFGEFLGAIIAPVIMAIVYFVVLTPISLLVRIFGKDLIGLKYSKKNDTYWIKRKKRIGSMKKQFQMVEFFKEFWEFLRERKKYWLLPIIIVLALFGALIVLSQGSAVAPFIYTIF